MAITRSAPSFDAASTPHSPTAPSPTTATVVPGLTPAETVAFVITDVLAVPGPKEPALLPT